MRRSGRHNVIGTLRTQGQKHVVVPAALPCRSNRLRIDGPWVFDGPINAEVSRTDVERVLVPTLLPGDIVIRDNLDNFGSHKAPALRAKIHAARAKLWYLPSYSPDLIPIEQVLAKPKHPLRKAATRLREAPWRKFGDLLSQSKPQECGNCLVNLGYVSVKT